MVHFLYYFKSHQHVHYVVYSALHISEVRRISLILKREIAGLVPLFHYLLSESGAVYRSICVTQDVEDFAT